MAYPYDYGVDLTPTSANGSGPYISTPRDLSGLSAWTSTITFDFDSLDGTSGQLLISQWGNGNILVFSTVNTGELGSAVTGVRLYIQTSGNIRVWEYAITLTGQHTFELNFDGSQTGDAKWTFYHAAQGDGSMVNVTSSGTFADPFGGSGGFPATFGTDTGTLRLCGDTFGTAHTPDGRMIDYAQWTSSLSSTNMTGTSMWDGTAGEPADHSSLSPVNWWAGGDDDITGSTLTDVGSATQNATLTANSGTLPSIVSLSSGTTLTAPLLATTTTFFAPTVSPGAVSLAPPLNATTTTLPAPTVSPGAADLQPPFVDTSTGLFAPIISTGALTLQPPVLDTVTALPAPTVSPGAVDLQPPLVSTTTTFFAPAVTSSVTLAPPFLDTTTTLSVPTVTPGAVDLQPPLLATTTTLFAPTVAGPANVNVTVNDIDTGASVEVSAQREVRVSVTIATGADVLIDRYTQWIDMPFLATTTTFFAPSVSLPAVNLDVPFLDTTTAQPAPVVGAGAVNLQPPLLASATTLPSPSVAAGAVDLAPPFLDTTTALLAPAVAVVGVQLEPPLLASATALPAPTVTTGAVSLLVPFLTTTTSLFAPLVTQGAVLGAAIGGLGVPSDSIVGSAVPSGDLSGSVGS